MLPYVKKEIDKMYSIEDFKMTNGNSFESLFHKLMKSKYGARYNEISPHGNIGDRKVDGVLDCEIAFAVYAPEIYKDNNTISKMRSDFEGFLQHRGDGYWKNIKQYIFVIKRERSGITANIHELLNEFMNYMAVQIWTLCEIEDMIKGYQMFSEDGRKLNLFKNDACVILKYIIDTDFTVCPFSVDFVDEIDFVFKRWNDPQMGFDNKDTGELIKRILVNLDELTCLLQSNHYIFNKNIQRVNYFLEHDDQGKSREYLKSVMEPNMFKIRKNIALCYASLFQVL